MWALFLDGLWIAMWPRESHICSLGLFPANENSRLGVGRRGVFNPHFTPEQQESCRTRSAPPNAEGKQPTPICTRRVPWRPSFEKRDLLPWNIMKKLRPLGKDRLLAVYVSMFDKSQMPSHGPQGPPDLAPPTSATPFHGIFLLILSAPATEAFLFSEHCWAPSCLGAFALPVLAAWNTISAGLAHSISASRSQFQCYRLEEAFSEPPN